MSTVTFVLGARLLWLCTSNDNREKNIILKKKDCMIKSNKSDFLSPTFCQKSLAQNLTWNLMELYFL